MFTARKLAIAGAAAAVVAGVCASPAAAATDPDLQRLYSATTFTGAQAAIQNAVGYGDRLDAANKKAHDAWPGRVAAYNKALAKYKAALRTYSYWLPVFEFLHRTPPPPPVPPTPPTKTRPALTDWAQFGRIGTVKAVKTLNAGAVSVTVTGIEQAFDRNVSTNDKSDVTFTFYDNNRVLRSLALRDKATPKQPVVSLVKTNMRDIRQNDKIGVIGTRWGSSAIGGLVVVKTL
jgi:hypothetical protein